MLLENNFKVTVIDNLLYNQTSLLNVCHDKNFIFIKADVTDFELMNKLLPSFDIIIPLAAIVGAPACNLKPDLAKRVNLDAIINIIDNTKNNQKILFPNTHCCK